MVSSLMKFLFSDLPGHPMAAPITKMQVEDYATPKTEATSAIRMETL